MRVISRCYIFHFHKNPTILSSGILQRWIAVQLLGFFRAHMASAVVGRPFLFIFFFVQLLSAVLPSHLLATVTGHLTSCSEMNKKKKKNPIYTGLSFSFRRFSWHGSTGSRAIQCVCTRSDGRYIAGECLRFGSTLLSFRHKQWKSESIRNRAPKLRWYFPCFFYYYFFSKTRQADLISAVSSRVASAESCFALCARVRLCSRDVALESPRHLSANS